MKLERNKYLKISFILAILGSVDSIYLTFVRYLNTNPICSVSSSCEMVLTSRFSAIGPFPLSLIGVFYYSLVAIMSIYLIYKFKKNLFNFSFIIISAGFIFSLALVFIQAFILNAFCQYCLISELIATLLIYFAFKNRGSLTKLN
jgi:uncharacterized membrane protein